MVRSNKVRRSVNAAMKDGFAWAGMSGFVDPYIIPFALAMGASNPAIGFLRVAPPLAASVAQIFNERMVLGLGNCRDAMRLDVSAQSASLFMAACAVLLPASWSFPCLAAAMILYTTAGNLLGPPWAALVGEYIPRSKRGAFFGLRNQMVGATSFIASLIAAKVLNLYQGLWVFAALFAAAGVFRLLSRQYIGEMYEPSSCFHMPPRTQKAPAAPMDPALRPFLISIFAVMFSSFLVAPYFSVYILKNLGYGYLQYIVIMTAGQLVTYMLMRRWGNIADAYGSVSVLRLAFLGIPMIPLLWALAPSFPWLVCVELLSGVIWAAYGMGTNNFIYEFAGAQNRTKINAMFGFTACLGQFGGALAGGLLYSYLPGNSFMMLLLISSVLRSMAILPFLRRVKEKDTAISEKPGFLMSALGFRSIDIYPAAAITAPRKTA